MNKIKAAAVLLLLASSAHSADLIVTYSARTDGEMVTACEEAIAQWAEQFDPVDIETSIAEPVRGRLGEDRMATLLVQIVYNRQGGRETRSATIDCTLGADGAIVVAEGS